MVRKLLTFSILALLLMAVPGCGGSGDDSKEVVVTSNSVSLRSWPSLKSKAVESVPEGTRMPFLGTFGDFYKTEYNGKKGYVLKSLTRLEDIGSAPAEAAAPEVSAAPQTTGTTYVFVDGYHVRLRMGPSTSYPYLTNGYGGTIYAPRHGCLPYHGREGNFYKVTYAGGTYYISCDFTHLVTK